ncbi:hypothetical protein [Flavobacterium sp. SLB02]|uniref:hypothetical protein n=1 Tax=Flavobacterium sp. SLB02 TaxID=2665645 RepID=UPI0012A9B9F3|nr:hypothetical protein [Flavobacterium sp. SLB02]QGK73427.1 hypothetical protein GIY83_04920 [Flavobacterium sp. SLB02]
MGRNSAHAFYKENMKNFFLFAIIALIVSSCQNDDPINSSAPVVVDPEPESPEEPVQGSFTIWEDNFEDGDVSDWVLLDKDGNNSNWTARKNIQVDQSGAIINGTVNILGTYNIDLSTGAPLEQIEQNWAIMPPIDLTYYDGKIVLNITAQPSIYDGNHNILIYGSTSTDPAEATLLGTILLTRGSTLDAAYFADYTLDISKFKGNDKVYISFLNENTNFVGYEIDKIWITAQGLLENISKKAPKLN